MNTNHDENKHHFPARTGGKIPSETFAWLRELVTRRRRQQLVTLEPQSSVRHCLQTGEPTRCKATYRKGNQSTSFDLVLERTAESGLSFSGADWPHDLQPLSVVLLKPLPRSTFRETLFSFSPSTFLPKPPESRRQSAAQFTLSADSGDQDEPEFTDVEPSRSSENNDGNDRQPEYVNEPLVKWDPSEGLRITLTDDELDAPVWAVAEFSVPGSTVLIEPQVVLLQQDDEIQDNEVNGEWMGMIPFPLPEWTYGKTVSVLVRPLRDSDTHLIDPDAENGPSDVTEFLSTLDFVASPLRRRSDRIETKQLIHVLRQPDTQLAFTAFASQKGAAADHIPFDDECRTGTPSSEADPGAPGETINYHLRAFCKAANAADQAATKSESGVSRDRVKKEFDAAWALLGPRLERFIEAGLSSRNDGKTHEDILQDVAFKIVQKLPHLTHEGNLLSWCYGCAALLVLQFHRHRTSKSGKRVIQSGDIDVDSFVDDSAERVADRRQKLARVEGEVERYLDRLTPREQLCWVAKYLFLNPQKLPLWLMSADEQKRLRQSSRWKLKALEALDFLGDRLSARERRFLEMKEVNGRKVEVIKRELGIANDKEGTKDWQTLTTRQPQRLMAAVALRALIHKNRLSPEEVPLLMETLFPKATSTVWIQMDDASYPYLLSAGHKLHAQILIETDPHLRDTTKNKTKIKARKLGKVGRRWLELTLFEKLPQEAIVERLLKTSEQQINKARRNKTVAGQKPTMEASPPKLAKAFIDPEGKFRGDLNRLREHVRWIWDNTSTLVPREVLTWAWEPSVVRGVERGEVAER